MEKRNELLLLSIWEVVEAELKFSKRPAKCAKWIHEQLIAESENRGLDFKELIESFKQK